MNFDPITEEVDRGKVGRRQMASTERGNIAVILCFMAHVFVHDESCPLHCWHKFLFKRYCSLRTLNMALLRTMDLLNWDLRVSIFLNTLNMALLRTMDLLNWDLRVKPFFGFLKTSALDVGGSFPGAGGADLVRDLLITQERSSTTADQCCVAVSFVLVFLGENMVSFVIVLVFLSTGGLIFPKETTVKN